MPSCYAFTDSRRQHGTVFRERLVLGESDNRSEMQRSGRWIASVDAVEVEAFR